MTAVLTLTTAGADTGPFDFYSDADSFTVPFEVGISKAALLGGYTSTVVPDTATIVKIKSIGACVTSVDIPLATTTGSCNLTILTAITTDPDNVSADNGTITITFSGGTGPFTYTLDGVPGGAAVSPLVVGNLSALTEYVIVITDSVSCFDDITFTVGESGFNFDADWIMLTYEFTDGLDLDTRTRIVTPNVGQTVQGNYVGWSVQPYWPTSGTPMITWGGDNRGTGFESVLINLTQIKLSYPAAPDVVIDARAFWFGTQGFNPVNVAATLWKGGNPLHNGCTTDTSYCWTNPTATATLDISSVPIVITSLGTPNKSLTAGQRAATLTYNFTTHLGVLNNNDTTTPTVPDA